MDRGSEKGCVSCFLWRVVYPAMAGSAYQKYIRYGLGLMVLILLIQPVFSLMNEGADPGKCLDEAVLKEKKGEMEQWIFQMQKKS